MLSYSDRNEENEWYVSDSSAGGREPRRNRRQMATVWVGSSITNGLVGYDPLRPDSFASLQGPGCEKNEKNERAVSLARAIIVSLVLCRHQPKGEVHPVVNWRQEKRSQLLFIAALLAFQPVKLLPLAFRPPVEKLKKPRAPCEKTKTKNV